MDHKQEADGARAESLSGNGYTRQRDEFQYVAEDRRYYSGRYIQAVMIYLAVLGVGIKVLLEAQSRAALIAFAIFFQVINLVAPYIAKRFRHLVYHSLDRESQLAQHLGFQGPYSLLWGYWAGVFLTMLAFVGIAVLAAIRYLDLGTQVSK